MGYIILSIPVFFLLIGAELLWSAWTHRKVYTFPDLIANIGCGIGSQVVGAFTKAAIFGVYLWTYDHLRVFTLPANVLIWVITFLLVDLGYYWFHRLSHEVNFLWAAHIVHHQSEEYNLSVALRQSWWQGLFSFWFYLPIAVLGVHPVVILTVGALNTLYQFWIHTRAIGRMGWLEHVFNTPSHHRVHHGSDPKYLDRNHAGSLIIWDKLFGTFQPEEEEPVYGITTPLRSWDPVWANFHYWADLVALARRCTALGDKVRVFLKPPGWRPADLGGRERPKEHDRTNYLKYSTDAGANARRYVLVQFFLLLAVTSLFLFKQDSLPIWGAWVLAGIIVLWVMGLGLVLEGRRGALTLEAVRVLLFTGAGIAVWMSVLGWSWWCAVIIFLGAASMIHLTALCGEGEVAGE
ncbi:MAG TPA: sterol desaturase family protein [Flavobacteriales bacterium]|nr:sterol desaturase family protein [Flavobacteriales bacterium]HNO05566.1 sterol desaturase family protein [Flavobacteriales bacterium]